MSKRSAKAARMAQWLEDNHGYPGCCDDLADSVPRMVIVARLCRHPSERDQIFLDIYSDEDLETWYDDTIRLLASGDCTDFDVAAHHTDPYSHLPSPRRVEDDRVPPGTLDIINALGDS
jgi:hypothetical protein